MCGIYGWIGKGTNTEKILNTFCQLGVETEIRGKHATGFYGVNSKVVTSKAPLPASDFYLASTEFDSLYSELPSVMIGHNRYATAGDPKINKNNHPFTDNRFGFIHNGCCSGWNDPKKLGITNLLETSCDSEWIFKYFTKTLEEHHGNMFSAIKKTLKAFDESSVACAMVDSKHSNLWLFRNIGNPICYIHNIELGVIFFASTPHILKAALETEDLPTEGIIEMEAGDILRINTDLEKNSDKLKECRAARSSYISNAVSSWIKKKPVTAVKTIKRKSQGEGFKCLKCGKKFISIYFVEKHLQEYHHLTDLEGETLEDYWENLNQSYRMPLSKKILPSTLFENEPKLEKKSSVNPDQQQLKLTFQNGSNKKCTIIRKKDITVSATPLTRTYTSFSDMQADTEEICQKLESMTKIG